MATQSLADKAMASFLAGGGAVSTSLADLAFAGGAGGGGAGGGFISQVVTTSAATYNAAVGDLVLVNANANNVQVNLPATTAGKSVTVLRIDNLAGGFTCTVVPAGMTINGDANAGIVQQFWGGTFTYAGGTAWYMSSVIVQGAVQTLPGFLRVVNAAYAATVTPNANTTDILNIAQLTNAITIAAPTGAPVDGQTLRIRMLQDGTGGRVVTWNAAFAFGTDITAAMEPTTANAKWERIFEWNATDSKWRATGLVRGF